MAKRASSKPPGSASSMPAGYKPGRGKSLPGQSLVLPGPSTTCSASHKGTPSFASKGKSVGGLGKGKFYFFMIGIGNCF